MSINDAISAAGFSVASVVRNKIIKSFPANKPEQVAGAFEEISSLFKTVAVGEYDSEVFINDMEIKTESYFDQEKAQRNTSINFSCVVSKVPF